MSNGDMTIWCTWYVDWIYADAEVPPSAMDESLGYQQQSTRHAQMINYGYCLREFQNQIYDR